MSGRTEIEIPATGLLPDAPPKDGDRPNGPGKTERELIVDRIAERAHAQRLAEMEQYTVLDQEAKEAGLTFETAAGNRDPDGADSGDNAQSAVAPAKQPVAAAPSTPNNPPAESASGPAAPTQTAPPVDYITVDLPDGNRINVTQAQLIHLARTGMIANQAIDQYQRQQQFQPIPLVVDPPKQEAPREIVSRDRLREVHKQITYGDENEGAAALSNLIEEVVRGVQPVAPPQINPVEIARQASALAQQEIRGRSDVETIRREYPDIVGDSDYSHLAALQVAKLRNDLASLGQTASDLDIFREAGNRVRAKLNLQPPRLDNPTGNPAPAGDNPPASQATGRIVVARAATLDARKREAPRQQSSVIDRRSPPPAQGSDRPQTASEVVAKMARDRGQLPMR